jgi:hypothetical protein
MSEWMVGLALRHHQRMPVSRPHVNNCAPKSSIRGTPQQERWLGVLLVEVLQYAEGLDERRAAAGDQPREHAQGSERDGAKLLSLRRSTKTISASSSFKHSPIWTRNTACERQNV